MSQVTGGLVSIEDGQKKAEEYAPPRKVRVELGFSVGEGEDFTTVFDIVSQAASTRVAALLNGTSLAVVTNASGANAPAAETPPPKPRVRRTQAQIEADTAAANAAKKAAETPPADTLEEPGDDAGKGAAEAPGDELGDLEDDFTVQPAAPATPATAEITDADLNSAVQKRNGELKSPDLIRGLIGEYNPDPAKVFQLRQIPQEKRQEFLDKLAALKVAA
jgi:hypothetical protein